MSAAANLPAIAGEPLAGELHALAQRLMARGSYADAQICRRAATELTLKISEDSLRLAQAREHQSQAELAEAAAVHVRRWMGNGTLTPARAGRAGAV